MKDPDSAVFGRFEQQGNRACLEVDGTNSYGERTGMKTAFLTRNAEGKWGGYTKAGEQSGWDECVVEIRRE